MSTLRDELVEMLERENETLRARIRDLEQQIGITFEAPPQIHMSRQESVIFGLLLKSPLVTKAMAMSALYFHEQDEAEIKIVDVYICKLRKKLRPWNIAIETVWGQGYRLTADGRAAAQKLLTEAAEMIKLSPVVAGAVA